MLTGVTKLTKVSVFSRLNHLTDLTMKKPDYAALLGWYDSYRFSHRSEVRVCNPISIGQAISSHALESYWVSTAMATLVMERIAAAGKTPDV